LAADVKRELYTLASVGVSAELLDVEPGYYWDG